MKRLSQGSMTATVIEIMMIATPAGGKIDVAGNGGTFG